MNNIKIDKKKLIKYLVLLYTGFTSYIAIECLFRGYSYALMGICGAIDFILIDAINDKISWDIPLIIQGVIGSAIITLTELIVGEIDKHILHIGMWDYSNMLFNFDGVICLEFSLLWVLLSLYAILLADFINYYLLRDGEKPYYIIFGKKFSY